MGYVLAPRAPRTCVTALERGTRRITLYLLNVRGEREMRPPSIRDRKNNTILARSCPLEAVLVNEVKSDGALRAVVRRIIIHPLTTVSASLHTVLLSMTRTRDNPL